MGNGLLGLPLAKQQSSKVIKYLYIIWFDSQNLGKMVDGLLVSVELVDKPMSFQELMKTEAIPR